MTPVNLLVEDINFRWPGKVQSLIYRIYEYGKIELDGRPFASPQRLNPRMKDLINAWSRSLFGTGDFSNYRIEFDNAPEEFLFNPWEDFVTIGLSLEIRKREIYNIRINISREMTSCCDIHCIHGNWKINGANIFEIKYVNDIIVHNDDGTVNHQSKDRTIFNRQRNFPDMLYMENVPTAKDLIQQSKESIAVSVQVKESKDTPVKKESKEFTDLKVKIAEMASIIKKADDSNSRTNS